MPTYFEEVRKCFKEACTEVQHQSNYEADQQKWYYDRATSTMQLMQGNIVLMKTDAFQGKRKVKGLWSKVEYVVVCQVADDVPAYKVCDNGGNVKIIHHNWPFLVATPWGEPMPLGASKSLSEEGTTRPALVELTPLEWESKVPESIVDKAAIPCLTSRILLGWVGGILWLLSTVAQRPTLRGLGAGDGMWSLSDEKVH